MIMLSIIDMQWPRDVLIEILRFCSTVINRFVLPKAMVGPTLLDVVVILNLPIHGEEQSSLFGTCCIPSTTLGIKFSKDDSRYSKFMLLKAKKSGVVSSSEHHAFLLTWFCSYFICIGSVGVVSEYCNFMLAITFNHDLALDLLLRGIFHLLNNLEDGHTKYNTISSPIWILILWARLYFLDALYPSIGLLVTKQDNTCYGQALICLSLPKMLAFFIANWLLTADFTLCFSLTPLQHQLIGSH